MRQTPTARDAAVAEEARRFANACLVERPKFVAAEIQPAADFAHQSQRHDPLGLHPEIGIAVALGHGLPGDLENMAEACGDDEAERIDPALQQRVGRNRRAVGEPRHVGDAGPHVGENLMHAANEADRGVRRRRRDLGDTHCAGAGINRHDVGECAAGIDADAKARCALRCCHPPCSCRAGFARSHARNRPSRQSRAVSDARGGLPP